MQTIGPDTKIWIDRNSIEFFDESETLAVSLYERDDCEAMTIAEASELFKSVPAIWLSVKSADWLKWEETERRVQQEWARARGESCSIVDK